MTDTNTYSARPCCDGDDGPHSSAFAAGSAAREIPCEAAAPQLCSSSGRPCCYVVVFNVSKKHNVGTLLRSCTAFGVTEVCLVGSRHFNTFGSHGADVHVPLRHFHKLEACAQYLKEEAGTCRGGATTAPSTFWMPPASPACVALGRRPLVCCFVLLLCWLLHRPAAPCLSCLQPADAATGACIAWLDPYLCCLLFHCCQAAASLVWRLILRQSRCSRTRLLATPPLCLAMRCDLGSPYFVPAACLTGMSGI